MPFGKYFDLHPRPARIHEPAFQRDSLHVRLQPQQHEIVIPPPTLHMDMPPHEQAQYHVINSLRGVAEQAAHLVVHGALEALFDKPQDFEQTKKIVTWAIEQKDIELDAAAARITELEKQVDTLTIERRALERALRS